MTAKGWEEAKMSRGWLAVSKAEVMVGMSRKPGTLAGILVHSGQHRCESMS